MGKAWQERKASSWGPKETRGAGWNGSAAAEARKPLASSDISAGAGPRGAAARGERCSGTRGMDSIIIKKNLFNLWV